jgi:hypothetical protein
MTDGSGTLHFRAFQSATSVRHQIPAHTLEEAKTLKAEAQDAGYRQVVVIDGIGLVQSV